MENFKEIENKWKKVWEENGDLYRADNNSKKKKKYVLVEFPYPSGSGLHVGHAFSFTGGDVYARFKRMQGENVLFPMGWDAFGLPTENYAIKMKKKPQDVTKENTDMFRKQMRDLAFSFDWSREVNTTDPNYYKWTQWIFIKLFEKGLAYKKEMPINWCPSCKIGLANEEVVDGKCERCGAEVSRRNISQWVVKITEYADKLVEGLKETDFIEKVKQAQINWIGKSEGAKVKFKVEKGDFLEVFTTRPDTLFGATFMVIAPEHELALEVAKNNKEVDEYIKNARKKSDLERTELSKDKTGVFSGLYAINPVNNEEIPIWISDFVLASYGTGAIMSVPAHDERDYDFAKKFDLLIRQVVAMDYHDKNSPPQKGKEDTLRKGVIVVVKHWEEDKYIQLRWKNHNWRDLITGGIEEGEDPLEAAKREVIEETGYQNIKTAEYIPFEHVDHFFAAHKDVNRVVRQKNIFIQLADGAFIEPDDGEKEMFEVVWLTKEEMLETINLDNHKYIFETSLKNGQAYTGDGIMINSDFLNDLSKKEAIEKMIKWLEEKGIGERSASYHLRDWIFSRQHYWGEPIPMINCSKCGWVPVEEKDLPIRLPEVEAYEPTDDGKSPLSKIDDFVKTKCPKCGGEAERETDTMPNWAGSDWYFLRYIDPHNDTVLASQELMNYWSPVDVYVGGDEHNVLHLLYSRFIYKFLWDIGAVPKDKPEPYYKRLSHGVILGPDGQRMSKSKGNVIVPEVVADKYGVDVVRMYLMFMGPFDATMAWNEKTLMGVKRFLGRFEKYVLRQIDGLTKEKGVVAVINNVFFNKTIDSITKDLEHFGFNTAIAKLMALLNELNINEGYIRKDYIDILIKLMAPFAPYTAEEMYFMAETHHDASLRKNYKSVHAAEWPKADPKYLIDEEISVAVAVNGKVRGQILINNEELIINNKEEVVLKAKELEVTKKWIEGKEVVKEIYIPGKMINFVVKE